MAKRFSDARLNPSDPPKDATHHLMVLRDAATHEIQRYHQAKKTMQAQRRKAVQALNRYEDALLEHRGQMTLFSAGDDHGTHETHLGRDD